MRRKKKRRRREKWKRRIRWKEKVYEETWKREKCGRTLGVETMRECTIAKDVQAREKKKKTAR